jgi:hypothetical protein
MIPNKKRQRHKEGDVFLVPLEDGSYGLGQILSYEPAALNTVGCAFYDLRVVNGPSLDIPAPLPQDRVISILLTTKDLLNRAVWPVVTHRAVSTSESRRPYEKYRAKQWVGAKISGSGIINDFLNAYHGLRPWNVYLEEDYFDHMLAPGLKRPDTVVVLDPPARAEWRARVQRESEAKRAALAVRPTRTRAKAARAGYRER